MIPPHEVRLAIGQGYGVVELDGRPIRVVDIHIDQKLGEAPLVTLTFRASVFGFLKETADATTP